MFLLKSQHWWDTN